MPYRPHKNRKKIPSLYACELLDRLISFSAGKFGLNQAISFSARDLGLAADNYDPAYAHCLQSLGTLVALKFLEEKRRGNEAVYVLSKANFERLKAIVRQ